jgi:hypothetical protein
MCAPFVPVPFAACGAGWPLTSIFLSPASCSSMLPRLKQQVGQPRGSPPPPNPSSSVLSSASAPLHTTSRNAHVSSAATVMVTVRVEVTVRVRVTVADICWLSGCASRLFTQRCAFLISGCTPYAGTSRAPLHAATITTGRHSHTGLCLGIAVAPPCHESQQRLLESQSSPSTPTTFVSGTLCSTQVSILRFQVDLLLTGSFWKQPHSRLRLQRSRTHKFHIWPRHVSTL